jgi:uncharacterized membrane protein
MRLNGFFRDGGSGFRRPRWWHVLGILALVVAAIGLPINHLLGFLLLLAAAVVVIAGNVNVTWQRWLAAIAVAAIAAAGHAFLPSPRIDEGHNIFLPQEPGGALRKAMPEDVYRVLAAQFDAQYPPSGRCKPQTEGCWLNYGTPDRLFAFSADGIFDRAAWSRRVAGIDFADPIWLRLGVINELRYNWYTGAGDLNRAERERRPWMVLHPWHLKMPWFIAYRFPAEFTGSALCWTGTVLWEGEAGHFSQIDHPDKACRTLQSADSGRRIFGSAIRLDNPLAMSLSPTLNILVWRLVENALIVIGPIAIILLLVRCPPRRLVLPFTLMGAAALVAFLNDASFIGGIRPFDGGDDGLQYESLGRDIVQNLLAGNIATALEGGEAVFHVVPGLRYFIAIERFVFGDTHFGYVSTLLVLPLLVFGLARRLLPLRWALGFLLFFITPASAIIGSSLYQYVKIAARGYADPFGAIAFLGGLLALIGARPGPGGRRLDMAFASAFLFAIAVFVRPNLAPAVAVILGYAGLRALFSRNYREVIALCVGFTPVLLSPIHNWVFGGKFVPLSTNADIPAALVTPPSAYVAAANEILHLDLGGEHVRQVVTQLANWLAGPSESVFMGPFNAVAVGVLIFVAVRAKGIDPWLRVIATAALALHGVALFYGWFARYHYLTWLLTILVDTAWLQSMGLAWLQHRFPGRKTSVQPNPLAAGLASLLLWFEKTAGLADAREPT